MSRDRAGFTAEQVERFQITDDELDAFEQHANTEGDPMHIPNRATLRPHASREERLAALPKYPRSPAATPLEKRLTRLADTAYSTLGELDDLIETVEAELVAALDRDEARAANRDRIAAAANTHRRNAHRR